ncbi:MAG: tRNA uridine-5-carboxymethylaminomethyl(34) synthesis GTPase MnmE [Clostridia bacterium]|nr:tRNA uridine-5-carboxymethylaminomethyl(34) synthesis GTPase MnmE [Clostridia bacterium]
MCETIAAISTAYGEGGIGIIRISGPEALGILRRVFVCKSNIASRRMAFGRIVDPDTAEVIDEVLAVYMKGPTTYTGEDVAEINCHGSVVSLRKALALVLRQGARMAEPGEFTKRAFLNGRMDLSQAEAVIDVIKAKADASYEAALSQMEGALSRRVREIRARILDVLVDLTVNIDYPDEDIEQLTYEKLLSDLEDVEDDVDTLLATAGAGRMIKEGIRVAIIGKPNVGKSSLMNCLLRQSRAIVTEIPGTTRDTIEEAVSIRNIPVYLIDTAGIRQTNDLVEMIGIERTKDAFNKADLIVVIVDASTPLTGEDRDILGRLSGRRSLVLLNKTDLGNAVTPRDIADISSNSDVIKTCLVAGEGVEEIEDKIEALVYGGQLSQKDSVMVNNVRHEELLRKAKQALSDASVITENGEALDIIEIDIREAYDYLGEIIGETVSDEVLDEVFSRFCLGK